MFMLIYMRSYINHVWGSLSYVLSNQFVLQHNCYNCQLINVVFGKCRVGLVLVSDSTDQNMIGKREIIHFNNKQ